VIVRNVFDWVVARGCPLHCAVWDTDVVENILKGRSDVSYVESGGRTALQLLVAQGTGNPVCVEITNSLFQREAFVDAENMMLQRTALHCGKGSAVGKLCARQLNLCSLEGG